ncbi:NapH/MauN family ferredoxin-type protein [Denitromonas iodatirespirans]|uniref:NapH/MauN family ferredoxin-type protein n=1 Tax=Denitromonas iodatirespirans TaxID=2795389 RepID=A0A944DAU3_DENI1|nr:NapH/MauN family ferredoxin-type protein [Denitromonas iodatirespirans]MBT0963119.1 NapH/MauN family ferredoxin-type protein [Denitromonas iodatirespirans]
MKGRFLEQIKLMLGQAPQKPAEISPEAQQIHKMKRLTKEDFEAMKKHVRDHALEKHTWRNRRWTVLILVNLLFTFSFWLDIQILEGALTASRFVGFHLIDLNSALQVMLAHKHIIVNLFIGTATVFLLWAALGGRSFCSWACPYHLVAEWFEALHLKLVEKKWVSDHQFHRGARTVMWVLFSLLALVTGFTVFETLSPTGILSRALIYGPSLALGWVALLLVFEVVYSRRAWCRYVCPIGLTYGAVGTISPVRVVYDLNHCFHEGDCRKVCLVPHVLEMVIKGRSPDVKVPVGPDCTRCGLCVDTCPSGALKFEVKGLNKLL